MTCIEINRHTLPTYIREHSTLTGRAAALVRKAWRAYWTWRARKATIFILRSLDERTLHDIGISASEIESCVYGKGGGRRRRYDEGWQLRAGSDRLKPPAAAGSRRGS